METYTISEAVSVAFNVNQVGFAVVYVLLVYGIVLGGLKRLGTFAERIIPPMSLFYIIAGLVVLVSNYSHVPEAFKIIFKSAFTPTAAVGGFGGAALIITIRTGISRSLWSNEAGWGTSPMAHATAKTDHPIKQSMWGVFEVFLFGWTTATGWFSYYATVLKHGFKKNPKVEDILMKVQTYLYPIPGLIMTIIVVYKGMPSDIVWLFSDLITAIPTYINLFVILVLSNKYIDLLNDYNFRYLGKPIPNNIGKIKLFYEDKNYRC